MSSLLRWNKNAERSDRILDTIHTKKSEVQVMESIYDQNEEIARKLNTRLTDQGVFAINVMGAPGIGKTSALIQMIPKLPLSTFVIEGDIESDLDTQRLLSLGIQAVQINTGGACHLDVPFVSDALERLVLERGFLFIENIGNLVCPAEFNIGEDLRLAILSVPEGDDKVEKYPLLFSTTDALLLNKYDMLPYFNFDAAKVAARTKEINPQAAIFHASTVSGEGLAQVAEWLSAKIEAKWSKN